MKKFAVLLLLVAFALTSQGCIIALLIVSDAVLTGAGAAAVPP